MSKKQNKKKSIFTCLLIFCLILACFNFFWFFTTWLNVNPFISHTRYETDLVPSQEICQWYKTSNSYKSTIKWDANSEVFINIAGFDEFNIKNIDNLLDTGHPSFRQGVYAMCYLIEALKENICDSNITEQQKKERVNRILNATDKILASFQRPFPADPMKINDHACTDRVEYFALLIAYLEENPGLCSQERLEKYKKQFYEDIDYLTDPRLFSWFSNHGLMQIRSQLILARMLNDCELKDELVNNAEECIDDLIPSLVADDGAVMEASSGYWSYIYGQMVMIYDNLPDKKSSTAKMLAARIARLKEFLIAYSIPGGYAQGVGDTLQGLIPVRVLDKKTVASMKGRNSFFAYTNQLAGIETPKAQNTQKLIFVSLDTPPPAHKLPEDLACYFMIGKPYFTNTGTYAYDFSAERKYVLSEFSQSTVIPARENRKGLVKPTRSQLDSCVADLQNRSYILKGSKWYGKNKISRTIDYSPQKGILEITDASDGIKELCSQFNISPEVTIKSVEGKGALVLDNGIETVKFNVRKGKLEMGKSWVSPCLLKKQEITQLRIYGNPVMIEIAFAPIKSAPMVELSGSLRPFSNRPELSRFLEKKYRPEIHPRMHPYKRMVFGRIGVAGIFVFMSLLFFITGLFKYRFVVIAFIAIISVIYLIDFLTLGKLLTFSYI